MDKWVEWDPLTGIKETSYSDPDDDRVIVTKEEDVSGLLDRNQELRNTRATDIGIQKGLWHYASIPVTVQYELLKKGLNIHRRQDWKAIYDEINRNYPKLKTTDKTHSLGPRYSKPKSSSPTETSTKRGPLLIVR
jgi:hypothetical protein